MTSRAVASTSIVVGAFAAAAEDSLGRFVDPNALGVARHHALPEAAFRFMVEVAPAQAAASAAENSLSQAGVGLDEVDYVISATHTPDQNNPGLVSSLLRRLSRSGIPGLEIRHAVASPIFALQIAAALIRGAHASRILVVCTDFLSRYFAGFEEQKVSAQVALARGLFSDGSAAFLVCARTALSQKQYQNLVVNRGYLLRASDVRSAAHGREAIVGRLPSAGQLPSRITADDVTAGRHLPCIDLDKFVAHFLHYMPPSLTRFAEQCRVGLGSVRAFVTHQTCAGLNFGIAEIVGIAPELFVDSFDSHGYIGSAGVAHSAALLPAFVPLDAGERVILFAGGAGFDFGFALLEAI